MWRRSTVLLLLISGCSKGREADLQYAGQARSLAAEWALVNEQANQGRLTAVYVRSMHSWLRDNLETTAKSLTQPDSRYGQEIRALLMLEDSAAPKDFRARADVLKQIEDSLESA